MDFKTESKKIVKTSESSQATPNENAKANPQAVEQAKLYIKYTPFSRPGLIKQLMHGAGFTREEANYAVDNCEADWEEQAELSAENYLTFFNIAIDELIDQLEYEGFTREQAVVGAHRAKKES